MPPTLATVADEAGVSRQTVSNALNNPELLRPETLVRVQSVIDRLGYSPNRAARQLRTRSSHLIGLRFEPAQEGTSNALMDRFLHSLVEAASRTGHHVLLFSGDSEDPLDGYDDLLRSTAVDAFVVTDTYAGTPQAGFLQDRGAPFVAFGRPWDEPRMPTGHGSTSTAPTVLASPPSTCSSRATRRVAWLGWEKTSRIGEDRRSRLGGRDARGQDATCRPRRPDHRQRRRRPDGCPRPARGPLGHRPSRAPATPWPSACCTPCAERGLRPGADVGVVGLRRLAGRAGHLARPDLRPPAARARWPRSWCRSCTSCSRTSRWPSAAGCCSPRSSCAARRGAREGSVAPAPHVDGVVDVGAVVLGEDLLGDGRRRTRCVRRTRGPPARRRSRPSRAGVAPSPAPPRTSTISSWPTVGVATLEPGRRRSSGSGRCRSRTHGHRDASPGRARRDRARSPDRRSTPSAHA